MLSVCVCVVIGVLSVCVCVVIGVLSVCVCVVCMYMCAVCVLHVCASLPLSLCLMYCPTRKSCYSQLATLCFSIWHKQLYLNFAMYSVTDHVGSCFMSSPKYPLFCHTLGDAGTSIKNMSAV